MIIMDYSKWAQEYWDAADQIGKVINALTIEIKQIQNPSLKYELQTKLESYVDIEIDMINTAKKLEKRNSKNENEK